METATSEQGMASLAVVQHGRRKGKQATSSVSSSLCPSNPEQQRQAMVLSVSDWTRIREQLSGVDQEAESQRQRQQQRVEKHERSKKVVQNWENTIDGQRLKRLQAMKLKNEQEEAERLKVDGEEREYQAAQRKQAIERAKTLLYYQTDRVKGFHGALLLSNVLKEREAQIAFNRAREERYRARDDSYHRMQMEELERKNLADKLDTEERAKAQAEVTCFQLQQAANLKAEKTRERETALCEQAAIEEDVKKFLESEREKQVQRRRDKETLRQELDRVLADGEALECRKCEQDAAEEAQRQIFESAKKKMLKMRRAKEKEIFQEFQQQQEKMTKQLHSHMQQKVCDEDNRIALAVTEQEAAREKKEREKAEKYLLATREIHLHAQEMMREKACEQQLQQETEKELLQQRVLQDLKFHGQQMEKEKRRAEEARAVQEFHRSQIKEQLAGVLAEEEDEAKYFSKNMELIQVEEQQFQEYAQSAVAEAKRRNAPIHPVMAAARIGAGGGHGPKFHGKGGIRPSYQATDSQAVELPSFASKQLPASLRRINTQKRMGFTW